MIRRDFFDTTARDRIFFRFYFFSFFAFSSSPLFVTYSALIHLLVHSFYNFCHRIAMFRSVLLPASRLIVRRTLSTTTQPYENIQVEVLKENVGLIRLHRPKALNALSDALFSDLIHAAKEFEQNDTIGCMIVTGSTKAFAAGADISEMKDRTFDHTYSKVRRTHDLFSHYVTLQGSQS
jgi:hypothetical protein